MSTGLTGLEGIVRAEEGGWVKLGTGLEGNEIKVLRLSEETGAYSLLVRAPKGTVNQAHVHSGPADFYIISGSIDYRVGHAKAGDWMYEPAGAFHEATSHPEDTLYLANVYGPLIFQKEDGSVDYVQDWTTIKALRDGADPEEARKKD